MLLMKTKLSFLLLVAPLLLMSCEGSRTRRMYDAGKSAYDDYENTGDPTMLIVFIVGILVLGGLWLWNKNKDN